MSIDDEWKTYLKAMASSADIVTPMTVQISDKSGNSTNATSQPQKSTSISTSISTFKIKPKRAIPPRPVCEDLYISTKTKVLFLNQPVDTYDVFWKIPVSEYTTPGECCIKKQMKIISKTREEYEAYQQRLVDIPYYTENIISQIDNPTARRIKFKDERKITVGVSKKDIMNCRGKVKHAFYNCFAIIMRFVYRNAAGVNEFREIHVKVFNTGKLEIPGILDDQIMDTVRRMVIDVLAPHMPEPLGFKECAKQNVLINSNFNCGYFINREKLHAILKSSKYNMDTAYDPCSYPGVKCKFYFNHTIGYNRELQHGYVLEEDRGMKMSELVESNKYTEVSIMIFRTGSTLLVGNIDESVLEFVYEFVKQVFCNEYEKIYVEGIEDEVHRVKKTKPRKRTIHVTNDYRMKSILL